MLNLTSNIPMIYGKGVSLVMAHTETEKSILEFSFLHKVMLFFDIPATWPGWAVGLAAAGLSGFVLLVWWLVGQPITTAFLAGGITLAFILFDARVFHTLPRRGLSYGNWKTQAFFLAVPRLAAATALAFLAWLSNGSVALAVLVIGQAVGAAALWYGTTIEPFRLTVSHLHVTSHRLPTGTPPIRVLHLSDFHIERLTQREDAVLTHILQLQPDLIVISGDFLNLSYVHDSRAHADMQKLLRQLHAPYGVYAVLGSPTVDDRRTVPALFADLPVQLLRDEWCCVEMDQGRQLAILGMDCTHELAPDGAKLAHLVQTAAAPRHSDFAQPTLFLYHSPELMPQASQHGFDLYLCGHTHGGQIRLPLVGPVFTSSQLGREYVMGHYVRGRTNLYISRGLGLEGLSAPRIRFLCPPEMILVTITGNGDSRGLVNRGGGG